MSRSESLSENRITALDGLRGVAALAVGFYHGLLHYDVGAVQRVLAPPLSSIIGTHDLIYKGLLTIFNGDAAVVIFFVLSGMVLTRSLDRMRNDSVLRVTFDFVVKRLLRIYPAVIGCMFFFYLMLLSCRLVSLTTFPPYLPRDIFYAATLLNVRIDGPLTTLQIELLAVPFLLIGYFLRRRLGMFVTFAMVLYGLMSLQLPALAFGFSPFAAKVIAFSVGCVVSLDGASRVFANFGKTAWIFIVVFFMSITQIFFDGTVVLICQSIAAAMLVGVVAYNENPLARGLNKALPRFLGKISFSFYLYNVPTLFLSWALIDYFVATPAFNPVSWGFVSAVMALIMTIPLSVASEKFVEQPFIRLGRTVAGWSPSNRRSASPDASI